MLWGQMGEGGGDKIVLNQFFFRNRSQSKMAGSATQVGTLSTLSYAWMMNSDQESIPSLIMQV